MMETLSERLTTKLHAPPSCLCVRHQAALALLVFHLPHIPAAFERISVLRRIMRGEPGRQAVEDERQDVGAMLVGSQRSARAVRRACAATLEPFKGCATLTVPQSGS